MGAKMKLNDIGSGHIYVGARRCALVATHVQSTQRAITETSVGLATFTEPRRFCTAKFSLFASLFRRGRETFSPALP